MSYLHFILATRVGAQGTVKQAVLAQRVPVTAPSFPGRANFALFTHRDWRRT